jgi:hypothetical protein
MIEQDIYATGQTLIWLTNFLTHIWNPVSIRHTSLISSQGYLRFPNQSSGTHRVTGTSSKIGLESNPISTTYCLKADYIVHVFDCGRIKDFESYHGKVIPFTFFQDRSYARQKNTASDLSLPATCAATFSRNCSSYFGAG